MMHNLVPDPPSQQAQMPVASRKLVLVIEESLAVCEMLCWALATAEYRTASLSRWQDALAWAEVPISSSDSPILILLDLSAPPDIDGLETLQQLRTQWMARGSTTPPIIVLTTIARVYDELIATGKSTLRKPFHLHELFAQIHKVLSSPQEDA